MQTPTDSILINFTPAARRAVNRYGIALCVNAYKHHQAGNGAHTVAIEIGFTNVQAADAAINAGRELSAPLHTALLAPAVAASAQPSPTIPNASLTSVERAAVKLGNLPADYSEMDRVSSPAYRKAERAVAKETARRQRY